MSGAVERLRPDMPAIEKAPALGMSIQVDLGSGRVATLQTFVDSTCSVREVNAMLDKMTSAGDRQRAHYKIEELERDLKQETKLHAGSQEDLERLDKEYDEKQAQRFAAIETMQKTVDTFMSAAKDAHVGSGRRGEFALKGTEKAHVNAVNAGIVKTKGDIDAATAERDNAHANMKITASRRQEIIDSLKSEIERCKALVEAGK